MPMRSNYVAVLDIRSSTITAVVGDRGVNDTFIIKTSFTAPWDGYTDGEFLDADSFNSAMDEVISETLASNRGIKSFYVSVPGEFLKLANVDKTLSLTGSKKITRQDVDRLVRMAMPEGDDDWVIIRHSHLYYVLSDRRKVIDPVGDVSDSLQGRFSFYLCSMNFVRFIRRAFKKYEDITNIILVPSNHAQAMYLVDPEKRDDTAELLDFGYISSTYSVVCGNGLMYSRSFSLGLGHIALYLSTVMGIPFEVAEKYLEKVNLNARDRLSATEDITVDGQFYSFASSALAENIRAGLDGLCEEIEDSRREAAIAGLDSKELFVTGEGADAIRGGLDHISGRLVKHVEKAVPSVPYYDKPVYGPLFSLLDVALNDSKKSHHIFS